MELDVEKMSSEEFVNSVKDEILNDNIYVFSPKGDIFELPTGSTPIDFAYKIHSAVGDTMVGAIVNNTIVPLDYELKNNDIVKIITNRNSSPSKEWLSIVKTTQARNKIRAYFAKSEKEIYIERGKEALEKELRRRKIPYNDFFTDENRKILYKELKVEDDDELYLSVGNGKSTVGGVINIIFKPEEIKEEPKKVKEPKVGDASVIVEGIDNIKVNLSNCCNPVPGDDIIGYITKGNGITVHRVECHNVASLDERLVSVSWNIKPTNKKFITSIMIYTNERDNKVLDIIQKINLFDIQVENVSTKSRSDANVYQVDIYVKDKESLDKLILSLTKVNYIDSVERVMN
jgi:GTP pyrophosphokinase